MKLPMNNYCADSASRGSLELGNRGQKRAVVAPRFFHFTITALTALAGQKFDKLIVGKVASYDGAMLNVPELFSKAVLLPMLDYGV